MSDDVCLRLPDGTHDYAPGSVIVILSDKASGIAMTYAGVSELSAIHPTAEAVDGDTVTISGRTYELQNFSVLEPAYIAILRPFMATDADYSQAIIRYDMRQRIPVTAETMH